MWNKPLKVLLENAPVGYAYHKIIANTPENVVDYVFLKFNHLFLSIIGMNKNELERKNWSDIPTGRKDHALYRGETFKKTALQGGYETYTAYSDRLDKWFRVHVFSPQKGYFLTLFTDISKEKEQLKQYESFFNINLDLLCIADFEGRFVKVNKEWERLLGYQTKELEGRLFLDFVHPQDLQKTKEAMEKLNHKDDVLNFSNRYLTKNGDYKIIEWRSHPHGDLIFAAARDITNSRTRERELMAILETTIDGFFIADIAGNIKRVNAAFCNMLGYEKKELLQMNILDFEASESKEEINRHKEMVEALGSGRFQTKVSRKDGTILDVEISVTIFTVETTQLVVFIRDISQQKKANLELKKREKQFSSLFWDSPVSIIIHHKDTGHVIEANHKALSLYGVDNIHDFDFNMMMCDSPYSCDEAKEWIKKTITHGPQNFEWRARRKDGTFFWEQVTLKQMEYYGEQVVIATGIDITQLKEAQKEAEGLKVIFFPI